MLSAVVIVLCEVLEAAILTAVLLALGNHLRRHKQWLILAFVFAFVLAALVARYIVPISDAFDGVGQELMNAGSLILASSLLLSSAWMSFTSYCTQTGKYRTPTREVIATLLMILIVITAVQRETSEVIIYLVGFTVDSSRSTLVIFGSLTGLMLGVSCGILTYYMLIFIPPTRRRLIAASILALIAAGMMSQSLRYLMQAGMFDGDIPAWNSSTVVSEGSISGQLLFATFGYEATPTWPQVIAYVAVIVLFFVAYWMSKNRDSDNKGPIAADA